MSTSWYVVLYMCVCVNTCVLFSDRWTDPKRWVRPALPVLLSINAPLFYLHFISSPFRWNVERQSSFLHLPFPWMKQRPSCVIRVGGWVAPHMILPVSPPHVMASITPKASIQMTDASNWKELNVNSICCLNVHCECTYCIYESYVIHKLVVTVLTG